MEKIWKKVPHSNILFDNGPFTAFLKTPLEPPSRFVNMQRLLKIMIYVMYLKK